MTVDAALADRFYGSTTADSGITGDYFQLTSRETAKSSRDVSSSKQAWGLGHRTRHTTASVLDVGDSLTVSPRPAPTAESNGSPLDARYEELLAAHGQLASKKFESGGLTDSEQRELRMIRWALNSIEMQQLAPSVNAMRSLVQLHRKLERDVDRLVAAIG